MKRAGLKRRPGVVFDMLEIAAKMARHDRRNGWVQGEHLLKVAGVDWTVGMSALENKRNPHRGLGFDIHRRRRRDGSKQWEYRLESYPQNWEGDQADLSHVRKDPPRPRKVPRGQQQLFPALQPGNT